MNFFVLYCFFLYIYNLCVESFYNSCSSVVLDMTKNKNSNEDEDSGDDLDFYDFVEVIADKIDSITHRSREEKFILLKISFCFFQLKKINKNLDNVGNEQKMMLKNKNVY